VIVSSFWTLAETCDKGEENMQRTQRP